MLFLEYEVNPWLVTYFSYPSLTGREPFVSAAVRQTFDIHWLLTHSYRMDSSELRKAMILLISRAASE